MRPLIAACLWAFSSMTAPAFAHDDRVALFKNVSGSITVVRNSSEITAVPGLPLLRSDKVVTDAGAAGGIVFTDGTLLTVGSGTEVHIRDYVFDAKASRFAFSVYLAKGTAIYSSGKIGKLAPESVVVSTPKATVGVRGTRFIVQAD